MTMNPGSRLGPYEILAPLGAGGMGEVYKARDTRLDRSVAVKILPAALAENAQFRLRFEREAKTISQLNHPHICTLYDVGENYLVMELLEGESLADRIARGPLPVDQVLRYGIEICEALEKAHRAGVVHRDLKPGNVMLTKSGAKLLDFGLAKSAGFEVPLDGATVQKTLTAEGTIVGTFQYMSPEQLEGLNVDQRTDIFALGAVLYEMATGRRAFDGRTRTSLIAAIVAADPKPMSELQPLTPAALEQLVRACLAKDPDDRIQTAHDVALQLRWIASSSSVAAAPVRLRAKRRAALLWPLVAAAVAIASWFAASRWQQAHAVTPVYSVTIPSAGGAPLGYSSGAMALSPDGSMLAYCGIAPDGGTRLFVRKLSEPGFRLIERTAGAASPFWSPDGRFIAYLLGRKILRVTADGSAVPEEVAALPMEVFAAKWGRSGVLAMSGGKLYRIANPASDPVVVPSGSVSPLEPAMLPGDRFFVASAKDGDIYVFDAEGHETPRRVVHNADAPSFANGHLFFVRGETLYAQPFDPAKLTISGEPQSVARVQSYGAHDYIYSVANDTLVYLPSGSELLTVLERVDRTGKALASVAPAGYFFSPRVSRDGTRVAVDQSVSEGPGDIWIFDVRDSHGTRFTFAPENESAPIWSPNDREIAYFMQRGGGIAAMRKSLSGGEPIVAIESSDSYTYTGDWSADGRWFATTVRSKPGAAEEVVIYELSSKHVAPGPSRFPGRAPRTSPDSKWLAYEACDGARCDVVVQPLPPNGAKWQVSVDGGAKPVWSRDGRSLYYMNSAGRIVESAVSAAADGGFTAQVAQPLFALRMRELVSSWAQYDVFPDGTFLVNRVPDSATSPMTAVINWRATLQP